MHIGGITAACRLNINGRVCFSIFCRLWGAGLIVVYFMHHLRSSSQAGCHLYGMSFFSLLLMGFLAVDTAITVSALTDFSRTIVNLQNNFNTYMDEVVEEVKERKKAADEKVAGEVTGACGGSRGAQKEKTYQSQCRPSY